MVNALTHVNGSSLSLFCVITLSLTRGPPQDGEAASFVSVATGISPTKQQSPIYRTAVDYVGSVKKAYENNPKIYTEFLTALEEYHGLRYGFSSYRVIGVERNVQMIGC